MTRKQDLKPRSPSGSVGWSASCALWRGCDGRSGSALSSRREERDSSTRWLPTRPQRAGHHGDVRTPTFLPIGEHGNWVTAAHLDPPAGSPDHSATTSGRRNSVWIPNASQLRPTRTKPQRKRLLSRAASRNRRRTLTIASHLPSEPGTDHQFVPGFACLSQVPVLCTNQPLSWNEGSGRRHKSTGSMTVSQLNPALSEPLVGVTLDSPRRWLWQSSIDQTQSVLDHPRSHSTVLAPPCFAGELRGVTIPSGKPDRGERRHREPIPQELPPVPKSAESTQGNNTAPIITRSSALEICPAES